MGNRLGLALAFTPSILWAGGVLVAKAALEKTSVFTVGFLQFLIASIIIFIYLFVFKREQLRHLFVRPSPLLPLAGVILAVEMLIWLYGIKLTTAIASQIIVQFEGIFFIVWGFTLFRESINRKKIVGIIMAISGVFLVSWNGEDLGSLISSEYFAGNILILLAAFLFSIYMACQKSLMKSKAGFATLLPTFLIVSFMTIWLVPRGSLSGLELDVWLAILYMGVFGSALGLIALSEAMSRINPSTVSVALIFSPVITIAIVVFGRLLLPGAFLVEFISIFIGAGTAVMILGLFLVVER